MHAVMCKYMGIDMYADMCNDIYADMCNKMCIYADMHKETCLDMRAGVCVRVRARVCACMRVCAFFNMCTCWAHQLGAVMQTQLDSKYRHSHSVKVLDTALRYSATVLNN